VRRSKTVAWLAVAGAAGLAGPALADDVGLSDMVEIMREEGVIDDSQYTQMKSKAEARDNEQKWYERLEFFGDFRGRYEQFWRWSDPAGGGTSDRSRARYRVRLGVEADINRYIDAVVRLASSEDDIRSTNQSLGRDDPDFDKDSVWFDLAYMTFNPTPENRIGEYENDMQFVFGKQEQPWRWKANKDFLLWDGDITPEGIAFTDRFHLGEGTSIYANTGYWIIQEQSSGSDPELFSIQLGADVQASDHIKLGARGSFYGFNTLNTSFYLRGIDGTDGSTDAAGNLPGGLSDSRTVNVWETAAYLTCSCFEDWPITVYGDFSQNTSAVSVPGAGGKQNLAWMAGIELGDKKKWLKFGALYAYIQANAFPAQYIDSDLFDGVTNRKGWAFYGSRQIFDRTDLAITVFKSDPIETFLPLYEESVANSDRVRLQTDVILKF